MKAMVIDGFGGADRLHAADLPTPRPGPREVLIKLVCTAVNPVDWKIREGYLAQFLPHRFPLVPGWDAAGTVAGMGADVSGFQVGDPVYAYCRKPEVQWGTYAEYVAMPADAVAPMPAGLSFAQAATIPLVGLTSWQSLFGAAGLKRGQSVLVHAGAGGIGSMAIQLAKWAGATVTATASTANHAYVRGLGADHVVDYRTEDFAAAARRIAPEGFDMVYATVAGDVMGRSYALVRKGGILVSITDQPDQAEAERLGIRAVFVFVEPNGAQLRELARLLADGTLRPPEVTEMPLDRAAEAQALSQAGHVRGKIALRVAEDA